MRYKSNFYNIFVNFKAKVENLFNTKTKIFHLDGGGELTSNVFFFNNFYPNMELPINFLAPTPLNKMVLLNENIAILLKPI